jgi:hypothetical protein
VARRKDKSVTDGSKADKLKLSPVPNDDLIHQLKITISSYSVPIIILQPLNSLFAKVR